MNRRQFLQQTAGAGALAAIVMRDAAFAASQQPSAAPAGRDRFKLTYAPHFGMFEASAGKDLVAQLEFMAAHGFMALEDNGMMKRPVATQELIGRTLARLAMTMGVFVIDGGDNWKVSFATGKPEFRDNFVRTCQAAVEVAKRVNAKWMTVVPGYYERQLPIGIQTGHVIDILRLGTEVLERHGLVMVLEPLSDNPDLFLRTADQAYVLCRAVASPSCKILFDMYHLQRNHGHIIPSMDLAWEEIGYFQIGDVPGRKEPGTGELNYQNIFQHIYVKAKASGRHFILGMEHGNKFPGVEGDKRLIEAYLKADSFEVPPGVSSSR